MIKTEFPEKAYESFSNHELMAKGYKIYIPSQTKEKSVGYDALLHLKGKMFKAVALQYKVVSQYIRPPKPLSSPCFKFELHKTHDGYEQHNIMVKRNTRIPAPVAAAYCVPFFVEYSELYDYLKKNTILENSCLLIPFDRINDFDYHYIAYDHSTALQFSKTPVPVKMCTLEQLFEQQKPLSFEDLITNAFAPKEHTYIESNNPTKLLDDYLLKSESMLLIKPLEKE